jgi:hypothetical protein
MCGSSDRAPVWKCEALSSNPSLPKKKNGKPKVLKYLSALTLVNLKTNTSELCVLLLLQYSITFSKPLHLFFLFYFRIGSTV